MKQVQFRMSDMVPGFFLGAPAGLILAGVGVHVMPAGASLLVGVVAGQLLGLAIARAVRRA